MDAPRRRRVLGKVWRRHWVAQALGQREDHSSAIGATRPGTRLQTQLAANSSWDFLHIDLKTAFLQGDTFDEHRDIVCQLPPEAGLPPHMGARLKRAAYGLNDAPRLWWNRLDKSLRSYGLVPSRADRCCYIVYQKGSKSDSDHKSAKMLALSWLIEKILSDSSTS